MALVVSSGKNSDSYKIYVALISQTSTDDPTVTILENTIGDIVWERVTAGRYEGTLNNIFLANKTVCFLTQSLRTLTESVDEITVEFSRVTNNSVFIKTNLEGTLTDGLLIDTSLEIRIYN